MKYAWDNSQIMEGSTCPRCAAEVETSNHFCPQCGHKVAAPAADSGDPLIGRAIADKYRVEEVLGSGAMGCIYLAQHMALDRRVALKVLHPHLIHNESMVMRFMREARAASRLAHANIVTLLDFGQDGVDGLLYLVMEHLEGNSLQQTIDEDAPLDLPRVFTLARQILLAMDEAHEQGVVHRDLKPENIITMRNRLGEETLKVLDFGLAQVVGGGEPKLTSTGLICGTPSYISPEQAREPEVGPSADIYSFGVILYEMITGMLPFSAKTAYEMVAKHLTEPAPHPSERAPDVPVPEPLAQLMLQCLQKDPTDRYSTAIELHEALKDCIGASTAPAISAPRSSQIRTTTITGSGVPQARVSVVTGPHLPAEPLEPPEPLEPQEDQACASCGRAMPPGAGFCGVCGASLACPDATARTPSEELPLTGGSASSEFLLLGRRNEARRLEQAGQQTIEGHGSAWLLSGEPGIGRSAMLRYTEEQLRGHGLKAHLVQASNTGAHPECIAALVRSLLDCAVDAVAAEVRARIVGLRTDDLDAADREALVTLVAPTNETQISLGALGTARATALGRLVRSQAAARPTAILLDDVSRLGGFERALLRPLISATEEAPLMLVLTDISTSLPSWSQRGVEQLLLGPLRPDDSERLLQRLVGERRLHKETVLRLVEASGGNPLYLVETIRFFEELGFLDTGRQRRGTPSWTVRIPANLRALVHSRVETLESDPRQALFHAAVIGRSFTLDLLTHAAGDDGPGLEEAATRLCQQGLLERVRRGRLPPRYHFRHEVIRSEVYDRMPRKEKRSLHDAIATALLTREQEHSAFEEIGGHLEQAARFSEASDMFERACSEETHGSEPEAVAAVLGRAVAALERSDKLEGAQSQTLHLQRVANLKVKFAEALNEASQWDQANPVALEARNQAMQLGDALLAAQASRQLARAAAEQGDLTLASSVLKESYEAALECGDLELASDVAADLSDLREQSGQLDKAIVTLTAALQRLEAVSRSRRSKLSSSSVTLKVAEILNRLGRVSLRADNHEDALRYLREALELARASDDNLLVARVLGNLGNALAITGDTDGALDLLGQALLTMEQTGDRLSSAKLLHNLACLHLQAGQRDEAAALARRSLSLSTEIGWGEGEELGSAFLQQLSG
jgi:eukaryotic-like serine/threonine-protein kinase